MTQKRPGLRAIEYTALEDNSTVSYKEEEVASITAGGFTAHSKNKKVYKKNKSTYSKDEKENNNRKSIAQKKRILTREEEWALGDCKADCNKVKNKCVVRCEAPYTSIYGDVKTG